MLQSETRRIGVVQPTKDYMVGQNDRGIWVPFKWDDIMSYWTEVESHSRVIKERRVQLQDGRVLALPLRESITVNSINRV